MTSGDAVEIHGETADEDADCAQSIGVGLTVLLICACLVGLGGYGVWAGRCMGRTVTAGLLLRRYLDGLRTLDNLGLSPRDS